MTLALWSLLSLAAAQESAEPALPPGAEPVTRSLQQLADEGAWLELEERIRLHGEAAAISSLEQLYWSARALEGQARWAELLELPEPSDQSAAAPDSALTRLRLRRLRGIAHLSSGEHQRAAELLSSVLSPMDEQLGQSAPESLETRYLLLRCHQQLNRSDLAHQQALELVRLTADLEPLTRARALQRLAKMNQSRGDNKGAERLYQDGLQLLRTVLPEEDPRIQSLLSDLAELYFYARELEPARLIMEQGLEQLRAQESPDPEALSIQLNNLAQVYRELNKKEEALALQQEALRLQEELYSPSAPPLAWRHRAIAYLQVELQEVEAALASMERAYEIMLQHHGPLHSDTARMGLPLAEFLRHAGERERPLELYRQALSGFEELIQPSLALGSPRQKEDFLRMMRPTYCYLLLQHWSSFPEDRESAEIALQSILQHKGRELEAEASVLSQLRKNMDPSALRLLYELQRQSQAWESAYRTQEGGIEQLREELESSLDDLQMRLAEFFPEGAGVTPRVTLEDLQQQLQPGQWLLELIRVDEPHGRMPSFYAAYLVSHEGLERWVRVGEVERVDAAVDHLRRQTLREIELGYRQRGPLVERAAAPLYEALLAPFEDVIQTGDQLIFSPAGSLSQLPLGMLSWRGEPLSEGLLLTHISSGRELVRPPSPVAPQPKAVIVAGVDFGLHAGGSLGGSGDAGELLRSGAWRGQLSTSREAWEPLLGSEQEGAILQRLMPESDLLQGADATESALRYMPQPALLHIATHGYYEPSGPSASTQERLLRNGLVLAGANGGGVGRDNGYLSAAELIHMDLRGTELVVLSACSSGEGEGIHGLRKALHVAGSETQVLSLWRVSDEATQALMEAFYRRLLEGDGRGEALRGAQAQLREDPRYAHPYFWASFVLSGEWDPLDVQLRPGSWWTRRRALWAE